NSQVNIITLIKNLGLKNPHKLILRGGKWMNGPILDILLNLIVLSGLIGMLLLIWVLIISMVGLFFKNIGGRK
ncbi:hypothetical protein WMW75_09075, partial [Streptococcus suis]|uniref:hypothetical protein n=1 Tax=Streptococcus suis TaxID=1307 RepID=UPI0030E84BD7